MINILIVDDSRTEAKLLKFLFESQSDMHVIGVASDGKQAVEMTERLKPDIITMDLEMPVMDGHTATRLIMSQHPTPIVVISSKLKDGSTDMTYLALEAGAVCVIAKPINIGSQGFQQTQKQIIETIRSMSEIKVIKRRFNTHSSIHRTIVSSHVTPEPGNFEIVAIGTSIGGPQALNAILSQLPSHFPVPIVIVQHMSKGFITGFTKWLNNNTSLTVKIADNYEILKKGYVYFAPDNLHLTIARRDNHLICRLTPGEPVSGFCPSITVLLQSIATTCGKRAIGVLLTGMGSDGSQGLLELKQAHGHTIIQDEKSCIVFGMASVAESIGAVDTTIQMDNMANYLIKMTKKT